MDYKRTYKYVYRDGAGARKRYGIFSPGVDRFLLVDYEDIWATLQTAEILSSKLPTMVFILSPVSKDINNNNCLDYTIFNKSKIRVSNSPMVVSRQHPDVKFLTAEDLVTYAGVSEDYNTPDGLLMLQRLKDYTNFVHDMVCALNITEVIYNSREVANFSSSYLKKSWDNQFTSIADRSSLENGIFAELRHILYMSSTIEEAEARIIDVWKNNSADQAHIMSGFYSMLKIKVPDELLPLVDMKPEKISIGIF
jgi:hypothetical protein